VAWFLRAPVIPTVVGAPLTRSGFTCATVSAAQPIETTAATTKNICFTLSIFLSVVFQLRMCERLVVATVMPMLNGDAEGKSRLVSW
jgi:hypothetical protein